MANSYAETLPTDRDWIRKRLDDRGLLFDEDGAPIWLRSNEAIDALLAQPGYEDRRKVAAELAEELALEFSRRVDRFTDEEGNSAAWSQRVTALQKTAVVLRAELAAEADAAADVPAFGFTRTRRAGDGDPGEYTSRPLWR